MSKTITRRAAVTALAAAPAALAAAHVPALAAGNPDAELFAAVEKFRAAHQHWRDYCPIFDAAEARRIEMRPPVPAALEMPPDVEAAFRNIRAGDIGTPPSEVKAFFEATAAEREAHRNACARADRKSGSEAAEREFSRRCDAASKAAYAVLDIPTATVAGLVAKLAVIEAWGIDENADADLYGIFRADIEAAAARGEPIALGDLSAVPSLTKGGAA